jgi:hypothetical protein
MEKIQTDSAGITQGNSRIHPAKSRLAIHSCGLERNAQKVRPGFPVFQAIGNYPKRKCLRFRAHILRTPAFAPRISRSFPDIVSCGELIPKKRHQFRFQLFRPDRVIKKTTGEDAGWQR